MFTFNFAPPSSSGADYFPVLLTALVSVFAIFITHILSRTSEKATHRSARVEQLYMESRKLIGDFNLEAELYRRVAEGHMTCADANIELRRQTDPIYGIGSDSRPYTKCELLIDLYFQDVREWLRDVNSIELAVSRQMRIHNDVHGIQLVRDQTSVDVIHTSIRGYTKQAKAMGPLLAHEIDLIDRQWHQRLRHFLNSTVSKLRRPVPTDGAK